MTGCEATLYGFECVHSLRLSLTSNVESNCQVIFLQMLLHQPTFCICWPHVSPPTSGSVKVWGVFFPSPALPFDVASATMRVIGEEVEKISPAFCNTVRQITFILLLPSFVIDTCYVLTNKTVTHKTALNQDIFHLVSGSDSKCYLGRR